jgi:hypothetical protein
MRCGGVALAIVGLLVPIGRARAQATLTYEVLEPPHIRVGESATLRITSLDGELKNVALPVVSGLAFELIQHSQGLEFVNGTSIQSTVILIRVTPQMTGLFSIPNVNPKSQPLVLDVVGADVANPAAIVSHKQTPTPPLVPTTPLPKGVEMKAGGAAFVQLVFPTRAVYVGESVPVDIEVGVRPGIVTAMNGLPKLNGGEFTLNNLSTQPERRERDIQGSQFLVMTWHSVMAAVKPGDFALSVETPLTVKINTRSAEDMAFAAWLGGPFLQSIYKGIVPKEVSIASPAVELKVLPLPMEGRPKDFSGAVGDFQVSSDTSPTRIVAGDPLTLRLHVSGVGNFDRVDSAMLDHLDHWKTYPAKSSFKASDSVGYKGEKVFEQPLIAEQPGEQTIPAIEFSYFNPQTQQYERARTSAMNVKVASSLADSSLTAPDTVSSNGLPNSLMQRLRADHVESRSSMSDLRPLYFQTTFLAVPGTFVMLLVGGWFVARSSPARIASKGVERTLARLSAAARSGDSASFFEMAKGTLVQTFAQRWQIPPDQMTPAELKARLGREGEDIERLFALADEAKYSDDPARGTDLRPWLTLVRRQLMSGTP